MVRLDLGRFGVGFWVGLRAWDFSTERVLPRTPLIIRTADQKKGHSSLGGGLKIKKVKGALHNNAPSFFRPLLGLC